MWWQTDGLTTTGGRLRLDGVPLGEVARAHGTPTYVYGAASLRSRVAAFQRALPPNGRLYYALKANRFPPLLTALRALPGVGIDACSPREVSTALAAGFSADEISVTAGMLSNRDLAAFAEAGVHLNLDTRSVLRRWRRAVPAGTRVGLRVDPGVRMGWGEHLAYGRSKFGFAREEVVAAAAEASREGLVVDTLHLHPGWGLPESAGPALRDALQAMVDCARALSTVRTLDVGGGLAPAFRPEDRPLSLDAWSEIVAEAVDGADLTVAAEPGTWLVAPIGALLVEVNTVERRPSGLWIGVDAGHAIHCYAAHYGIPSALVPVERPLAPADTVCQVAGNINEANDVFARDRALQLPEEGEIWAIVPAGAYGSAMASDHCLRGRFQEVWLDGPLQG
jgi:diaminopimelate decarboxylase